MCWKEFLITDFYFRFHIVIPLSVKKILALTVPWCLESRLLVLQVLVHRALPRKATPDFI